MFKKKFLNNENAGGRGFACSRCCAHCALPAFAFAADEFWLYFREQRKQRTCTPFGMDAQGGICSTVDHNALKKS